LRTLLNSSVYFEAISAQKSLIILLTGLLRSANSLVALLAAQTIRAALHFQGRTTNLLSVEKKNKRAFLTSDADGKDDTPDVLSAILGILTDFERSYDNRQKVFPLHMTGIYVILSSVLESPRD